MLCNPPAEIWLLSLHTRKKDLLFINKNKNLRCETQRLVLSTTVCELHAQIPPRGYTCQTGKVTLPWPSCLQWPLTEHPEMHQALGIQQEQQSFKRTKRPHGATLPDEETWFYPLSGKNKWLIITGHLINISSVSSYFYNEGERDPNK